MQKRYLIKDYYKTIQRTLEIQQKDNEKIDEKLHWTPYQVSKREYTCHISTQKDDPYDILTEKYKLKQQIIIPSIPWYLSKGSENLCSQQTCILMTRAALFITAKIWKQNVSYSRWIDK